MQQVPAPMVADFAAHIANHEVYVACLGKRLVGYVVAYHQKDIVYLDNVAVLEEFVGQGIGKGLICFIEDRGRQAGCQAIKLYTNEKMRENIAMYQYLGYDLTHYGDEDGFNRAYFNKTLI